MANPYESERLVAEYLCFHYPAAEEFPLPAEALDFPKRLVDELADFSAPVPRALDVGCAVGRSSFELARSVPEVVGIDFSAAFIAASDQLRDAGEKSCEIALEGDQTMEFVARVPVEINRGRASFEVGDAMDLRADLGSFDLVLAANLICRLPEPLKFLNRLPGLVASGGQLLLTTPFSWLREYTPEHHWLGGRNGGPRGWEALQAVLAPDFELEAQKNLPFLIREHSRKFQYGISLGSRWRRR